MMTLGRPPIESPEPVVKFAALRLLLSVTALVALIATGFPFGGGLTAVVAGLALPWALANTILAQRLPERSLHPLIAAGDLAVITAVEVVTPQTYGAVRFLALFFIAAHAQFQGQNRGLLLALGGSVVLVPIAIARGGTPVHGDILAFYESLFVVCAFAAAVTGGNIRISETTGRLRARLVSRRMIQTEAEIRRRVAESIHDGPVQELVSLDMILSAISNSTRRGDEASTSQLVDEAHSIVERNIQALRDEIVSLGPYAFRELTFETAVADCVPVWRRRYGLNVKLEIEPLTLSPEVTGPLFQIAQEAVTNAGRHSEAQHVTLSLHARDAVIELRVVDDGRGFGDIWPGTTDEAGHIGLSSMRERAEMVGGSLRIESGGRGTTVVARVPFENGDAAAVDSGS